MRNTLNALLLTAVLSTGCGAQGLAPGEEPIVRSPHYADELLKHVMQIEDVNRPMLERLRKKAKSTPRDSPEGLAFWAANTKSDNEKYEVAKEFLRYQGIMHPFARAYTNQESNLGEICSVDVILKFDKGDGAIYWSDMHKTIGIEYKLFKKDMLLTHGRSIDIRGFVPGSTDYIDDFVRVLEDSAEAPLPVAKDELDVEGPRKQEYMRRHGVWVEAAKKLLTKYHIPLQGSNAIRVRPTGENNAAGNADIIVIGLELSDWDKRMTKEGDPPVYVFEVDPIQNALHRSEYKGEDLRSARVTTLRLIPYR